MYTMAGRTKRYYDRNPAAKRKKAAYDKAYNARPEQKKNRAKRNAARAKAAKAGKVRKGDGKDVHHTKGINSSKTKVMSASKNRGIREKSRRKGYKRKK